MYYMLLATADPDRRLLAHEQDTFEKALKRAERDEFPDGPKGPYKPKYPQDGRTLAVLQSEAAALGINAMGKTAAVLRGLIEEEKTKQGIDPTEQ